MAVETGNTGSVIVGTTDWIEVTKWTFDMKAAVSKWGSNSSSGFKKAVAGTKDGSGTIEVKIDTGGTMDAVAGASATLLLHTDDSGSNYYSVPAVIASCATECDIDDGTALSATYNFESNGEWTYNGAVASS